VPTAPLFAERTPVCHERNTPALRAQYDAYLASRLQYKKDFFADLATLAEPCRSASRGGADVLEVGTGYGAPALALIALTPVRVHATAEDLEAAGCYRTRLVAAGTTEGATPAAELLEVLIVPGGIPVDLGQRYQLVYSVNTLHTWADAGVVLAALDALLAPGGTLLVTDVRRDPDPFITEYVLRELAAAGDEEGVYRARTLTESLSSAFTVGELLDLAAAADRSRWQVDADGPMAMTLRITAQGRKE
jgi:SAM-dependent methyltransferase